MTNREKWGLGIVFVLGVIYMATKKAKTLTKGPYNKEDDINLLILPFRDKVKTLIQRLKNKGFDPVLRDSGRTAKEAAVFANKGTGILKSLHLTGAAADIISRSKGWSSPEFFQALGKEAKALGLTWGANKKYGGDFNTKNDQPHVQAIPIALQNQYRALTSDDARIKFIRLYYDEIEPDASLIV